ncbi:Nif3-like dinuclear metal center hexameric protein [Cohnella sp. WQ 127256]|uniref:Nif3-like dinuclear metal center hexameric protein n=1 Tax=Cohnella sp. WQ 127256 TaxID=2938790 RepID=UPI0027412219|nr:Nif3-like dinuclear metal center hexameric protein [Cohnella sp. WQ 127256]
MVVIKIQDVIDVLMAPVGDILGSIDKLIVGNPSSEVTGIAVTFIATHHVLEQAYHLGANLIIAHEGTFYSHTDSIQPHRGSDLVYNAKKQFIDHNGLAIYRFHDYCHRYEPDIIMEGLIKELGWQAFVTEQLPVATVITLPSCTVREVVEHVKKQLGIGALRAVGDLTMTCERIGLLIGYRGGGELVIPMFDQHNLDLILYGEGPEWETPEYVRDAIHMGQRKTLLVVGHLESEQPGMRLLADRIGALFPRIPVHFIPVKPVFHVV